LFHRPSIIVCKDRQHGGPRKWNRMLNRRSAAICEQTRQMASEWRSSRLLQLESLRPNVVILGNQFPTLSFYFLPPNITILEQFTASCRCTFSTTSVQSDDGIVPPSHVCHASTSDSAGYDLPELVSVHSFFVDDPKHFGHSMAITILTQILDK
jgi:hypothetical protein